MRVSSHTEIPNKINILNEDDDENLDQNDIVVIELLSTQFKVNFSKLCKYSKEIRDKYHIKDAREQLSLIFQNYQNVSRIKEESIITFFKLIQEEDVELKPQEYCDLCKLSQIFEVNKLIKILKKYFMNNSEDISFISSLIIEQNSDMNEYIIYNNVICSEIEECLINKVDECLQNEQFGKIPISTIYRILEKSQKRISSDLLYDFIRKSIGERYILFHFVEISQLSEDKIEQICNDIDASNPSANHFYEYLKLDLVYMKSLKYESNEKERQINSLFKENNELKQAVDESNTSINQLLQDKQEIHKKFIEISTQKDHLLAEYNMYQKTNADLNNQLSQLLTENNDIKQKNIEFQTQCKQLLIEKNDIEKNAILLKSQKDQLQKIVNKFKEDNKKMITLYKNLQDKYNDVAKKNEENKNNYENVSTIYFEIFKVLLPNVQDLCEMNVSDVFFVIIHQPILHYACKSGNIDLVSYIISLNQIDIESKSICLSIFDNVSTFIYYL